MLPNLTRLNLEATFLIWVGPLAILILDKLVLFSIDQMGA